MANNKTLKDKLVLSNLKFPETVLRMLIWNDIHIEQHYKLPREMNETLSV